MGLYSDTLDSLHNGVSQQSPMVRSKDQLEAQENSWSSLADGVGKRPPTEFVASLMATAPTSALVHEMNRDATHRYIAVVADGEIKVFGLDGTEHTVTAPHGWDYLDGVTDFSADVHLFTVADYTFVVNRKKVCAMAPLGADQSSDPAYYIWSNQAFGTDADGGEFGPGVAYQYPPNPVPGTYKGEVQRFDKLPTSGITNGDTYKIAGTDDSSFISYYVRRAGAVWDETVAPGLINGIDAETMPHALVRQEDGSFVFAPFSWAPRRVGDEFTNPNPGFIGRTIRKAFLYQNRLCFLYDANAIGSCAGDFGNFWRNTVLDLVVSDVIDVAASSTKVSILVDAVPFNDGILLTSDQTQFSMSNGEAGLTAEAVAIRPVTNYPLNVRAGMVAIGSEAYFATERNGYSAIWEYSRDAGSDALAASDITAHVPRYIPSGIHQIIPAGDQNALFVLTSGAPSKLFVYQFYWLSAQDKAQSAWHEWDLGDASVIAGSYLGGYLYLLVDRGGELFLERVDLQSGAKPSETPGQVYLDRRTVVTGTYSSGTDRTTFALDFEPDQDLFQLVRGSDHEDRPLSLVDPSTYEWVNATTVKVPGDETAGPLVAGEQYTQRIVFSRQYPKKPSGSSVATGRLQLRTWTLSYTATGYFATSVSPYGSDIRVEPVIPAKVSLFTGRIVGAEDLILNEPQLHTGTYSFQVMADAAQCEVAVSNDTHVGATFVAAAWEAFYFSRARI